MYHLYKYGKYVGTGTKKSLAKHLGYSERYMDHFVNGSGVYRLERAEPLYAVYEGSDKVFTGTMDEVTRRYDVKPSTVSKWTTEYWQNVRKAHRYARKVI